MKTFIYHDIETAPTQREDVKAKIAAEITHPGSMKKAETIAAWEKYTKPNAIEEAVRKTALDGARGQIVCLSYAIDDSNIITLAEDDWKNSEKSILQNFFLNISGIDSSVFVGHNAISFDIRFIYQRAIVNNVTPPKSFMNALRRYSEAVYDTMTEWAGFGNYVSMDKLCEALGIDVDDEITGADVYDCLLNGELDKVIKHNRADVEKVRMIHKRMTFSQF